MTENPQTDSPIEKRDVQKKTLTEDQEAKMILETFHADVADLIVFIQTFGLFYTAGIEFGLFDYIASWTEEIAIGLGTVSSIGSFFISLGYIGALVFVLHYLYKHVYHVEPQREMNAELALKYVGVQLFCFVFILGESLGCNTSVVAAILMVIFAFAHALMLIEVEIRWEALGLPVIYTFKRFFSLLAIPVVGIIAVAIVDGESVNESNCYPHLAELSKALLSIPLSFIILLLIIYHAVLADIDFTLRLPTFEEEGEYDLLSFDFLQEQVQELTSKTKRKIYIGYKVIEIIERITVTIMTQTEYEEEEPEETGELIRHLIIQYCVLLCISIYYVYKNKVKRKIFTIFPRVAIISMLFVGQALNNFNVCILEVEEFAFIELTYYNNTNATDFSECFVINTDDVAVEEIEAIELQRLTDEKFLPALLALIFGLIIIGIWFYHLQPVKVYKAWRTFQKRAKKKEGEAGVETYHNFLLDIKYPFSTKVDIQSKLPLDTQQNDTGGASVEEALEFEKNQI